jgi:hypothetical protein
MTGLISDSTIATNNNNNNNNNNKKQKKRIQSFKTKIENNLKIQLIEVKTREPVVDIISSNNIELEPDSSLTSENDTKSDVDLKKDNRCPNGHYSHYSFNNFKKQALECSKRLSSIGMRNHKSKSRCRLINKNGESNLNRINIPSRSRKYIADLFTTLIDMKWTFVLLIFILSYLISWLLFAFCWHIIQCISIDCITNVNTKNIISSILFSIETQQTIGYGSRHLNDSCELGTLLSKYSVNFYLNFLLIAIFFSHDTIMFQRSFTIIYGRHCVCKIEYTQKTNGNSYFFKISSDIT